MEETPRATDEANLEAMADMIKQLEAHGHTYRSDGSIYFKISTLPEYGKLARLDHAGIQAGARVDADEYNKEDARDFVLWKATKPGEPTWDCGVGPGRPGWHIECSAMALRLLGESPIDIHTGGIDLVFPHHENEIAQSEGATGKPFSRFWVHIEHLLVDDQKMSKSLGNVYTLSDITERGFRVSALRYLLLSAHYRKQLNFTWVGMQQAEEALRRLTDFLDRLDRVTGGDAHPEILRAVDHRARRLRRGAVRRPEHRRGAGLHVRPGARRSTPRSTRSRSARPTSPTVRKAFDHFDDVLGVLSLRRGEDAQPPMPEAEIQAAIEARHAARRARNFAEADRIRDDMAARGVIFEDGPQGTRWKRK